MSDHKPATGSERQPADLEVRSFPFQAEDVRTAEGGRSTDYTIRGHAAVFNTWTDLGAFRERIAKTAFDDVLATDPHVLHVIDHDTGKTLSSTRSNPVSLELRVDPKGLHFWSRVDGEVSYAKDLRRNLERGIVNQSSFAFTVPEDGQTWVTKDGVVERTITRIDGLYDVTTTAMGAYPTTDSQVASRTLERARAVASEGLPDSHPAETPEAPAAEEPAGDGTEPPPDTGAGSEESTTATGTPLARDGAALYTLKRHARRAAQEARELQDQIEKGMSWR